MMSRTRFRISILVALVAFAGCSDPEPPVAVGTLERHRIELRAERQEPIIRLAVREGDLVQAGDVVAELDRRRVSALLAQSKASRDLAAARLAEKVRGPRDEDKAQARAELAEAEAALIALQPDLARVRELVDQGVETQSVLDAAEASNAAAESRRDAASAVLDRTLNGATVEELNQARSELAGAEAEIAKLEIDVGRMVVVAPTDGTVEALPFKFGDEPPVGSTLAVILTDGAPFARVYVPASLRAQVHTGDTAFVHIDGIGSPFQGTVRRLSAEAAFTPYYALTERDRGHLTYLAEIDLTDDAARNLPTGLPVEVSF